MKRVELALIVFLCLLAAAFFGCTQSSGGDDDNGGPGDDDADDDADDDTADDDSAGLCGDAQANQYAAYCSWYDDPCQYEAGEFYIDDNEVLFGEDEYLTGEMEGTQFILDTPFHVQKIKLYFDNPGGQAKIHVYADLLGSEPTLQPGADVTPVEYMDPITIDVTQEGWVEVDVSDQNLLFMPSTKFWVIYEHLTDDGLPTLAMSHAANIYLRSRFYTEEWAQENSPFKWGYANYYYLIHLVGNRFCVWDKPTYFSNVTETAGLEVEGQHRTAWSDVDGDGNIDMILTKLGDVSLPQRIAYFHNNGNGTFTNATAGSGLDGDYYSSVTLMADYDNNGTEDAIIIAPVPWPTGKSDGGAAADDDTVDDDTVDDDAVDDDVVDDDTVEEHFSLILLNDGTGHFTPKTDSGLAVYGNLSSASLGDYDRDGVLDLYVGAWLKHYPDPPCDEDYLFHNEGDGTFSDVSEVSGIRDVTKAACYGVTWVDFNNDGWYDVFVSNYGRFFSFLFENKGDGTFVNVGPDKHLDAPLHNKPGNGFGADFGDLNADGYFDAFQADIAHPRYQPDSGPSSLSLNGGPDADYEFTLANDQLHYVPDEGDVDPSFIDYNNDGRLDLFVSSLYDGHFARLYEQQEDGTLMDVTYWADLGLMANTDHAWADYDADGKLDLVATFNYPSPGGAVLYHNDFDLGYNWVEIRLIGTDSNRDAVGAKITVTAGGLVQLRYVQGPRGHYGSTPQLRQHFGLRAEGAIDQIEVQWPNGATETWEAVEVNRFVTLTEGDPGIVYE